MGGQKSRGQALTPEEVLCEQGCPQKHLSIQLGLARGHVRVGGEEKQKDTEKGPKRLFNNIGKEFRIYEYSAFYKTVRTGERSLERQVDGKTHKVLPLGGGTGFMG